MEFLPAENGSYHYATLNPRHFNPFDCDGEFRKIPKQPADGLAKEICNRLEQLTKRQSEKRADEEQDQSKAPEKRKLTPLYSAMPTKKQKVEESSNVKEIEQCCNKCQFDSKYSAMCHFIILYFLDFTLVLAW